MNISDELIELIKLAQGNRSLNKFSKDCGISAGNLSKILRKINPTPPSITTLHKIALNSQNNITLVDLMIAAGFMEKPSESEDDDTSNNSITPDPININEETEKYKKILLDNVDNLIFSDGTSVCPEILNNFLDSLDIGLGIFRIKNKKAQES